MNRKGITMYKVNTKEVIPDRATQIDYETEPQISSPAFVTRNNSPNKQKAQEKVAFKEILIPLDNSRFGSYCIAWTEAGYNVVNRLRNDC